MTPRCSGNKKYGYQTGNSLLFVRPLQRWLSKNSIAVQSKLCIFFFLLQSLTSNPHHDSYLSFLGRNLDLRTSMLGAGSSVTVKISLTNHDCIHEFPQITLCLPVNSRITQNLLQTLIQWCQFKTARTPFATSFSMPFYISSYCSGFVISAWCSWKVGAWDERM